MSTRITTAAAATRLGVTESRIRAMLAKGILTGVSEPFGPGTRWMVDAESVTKRKRAKVKAGRPKGCKPLCPICKKPLDTERAESMAGVITHVRCALGASVEALKSAGLR